MALPLGQRLLPQQTVHPIIPSRLPSSHPSLLQQSGPSQRVPPGLCPLAPNQLGVPAAHLHTSGLEALLPIFHTIFSRWAASK